MDVRRLHREMKDLADAGHKLKPDLKQGKVKIFKFEFPSGWNPTHGNLLFDLPSSYPNAAPNVYFSEGMSFRGNDWTEIHRPSSIDHYDRFCLHDFNWKPEKHTLTTMTKVIVLGLNNPDDPNQTWRKQGLV